MFDCLSIVCRSFRKQINCNQCVCSGHGKLCGNARHTRDANVLSRLGARKSEFVKVFANNTRSSACALHQVALKRLERTLRLDERVKYVGMNMDSKDAIEFHKATFAHDTDMSTSLFNQPKRNTRVLLNKCQLVCHVQSQKTTITARESVWSEITTPVLALVSLT